MGMSIDDVIRYIKDLRDARGCGYQQANVAIETMRKYQKIVDIVSLNDEEFKQCGLKELKEILEVIADGTINSSDCV